MSNITEDAEGQYAEHLAEVHMREERIEVLKNEYPTEVSLREGLTSEQRFVVVQQDGHDGDYFLASCATFRESCAYLGDEILDGWMPVAVFDLDTAERIEIHVSSPVVTRSEDQGSMMNPLNADEVADDRRYQAERFTRLAAAATKLATASGLPVHGNERIEGILRRRETTFSINGVSVEIQSIVLKEDTDD